MIISGCGRRNNRTPFDGRGLDPSDAVLNGQIQDTFNRSQYARFAAILVNGRVAGGVNPTRINCQPWESGCNSQNNNGGREPWEQGTIQDGNGTGGNLTAATPDVGSIVIAELFASSTGRILGTSTQIPGVRAGSQIAYSSEGSTIFVTTGTNSIWSVPAYPTGALGRAREIGVGAPTFEIASARTPEYEIIMASKNDGTVAIMTLDPIPDPYTKSANVRILHPSFPITNYGKVTTIAASPTGEWWFFGVNHSQAANAKNGGFVLTCHLPTMLGKRPENVVYSRTSFGLGLGCSTSIPQDLRNPYAEFYTNNIGIGMQFTQYVPYKLAIGNSMAAFIHPFVGPYRLQTPDIADMDVSKDPYLRAGPLSLQGNGTQFPTQTGVGGREYVDMFIHPHSDNLVIASKDSIQTVYMDNRYTQLKAPPTITIPGADFTALALDPGSLYTDGTPNLKNSSFALAADRGNRKIWILNLNSLAVGVNTAATSSDAIQLAGYLPIDVAIRTRTTLRARSRQQPVYANANPSTPLTTEQLPQ